jgi:hypothetical protein
MSTIRYLALAGGSLFMLLNTAFTTAQEASRDPTVAPAETGAPNASPAGAEGMTVLVRDDKPYLVVGARLYAPGDKVGNLRVERITEREIWFHDGSALIKAPRFAGIERKALATKPPCAAPAKSAPTTVAPCEDTQP